MNLRQMVSCAQSRIYRNRKSKIFVENFTEMDFYYAGFNPSSLFDSKCVIENFTKVPFDGLTDFYSEWNYFILWRNNELWITGTVGSDFDSVGKSPKRLFIPDEALESCFQAIGDTQSITILTSKKNIWRYMIYEETWRRIPSFVPRNDEILKEEIVKIEHGKSVVALSNLGRVFNAPILVDVPKKIKFVDISCGIEHTLMLTDDGNIYSMGLGTRGQLGHGDLEDCDEPRWIEALGGLRVSQISASGWCNAVVTNEGDLYVWGWNNEGQLGPNDDNKVISLPKVVDFKDKKGNILDIRIVKAQCTSAHTICLDTNGDVWGCGSNKYGQLGRSTKELSGTKSFMKLFLGLGEHVVKDIKCSARGTLISVAEIDPTNKNKEY